MAGKSSVAKEKSNILLDGSDAEDDCDLKINQNYAERYEKWRGKEELQKYTDRYGADALKNLDNSDNESTSTEEDEDARELTVDVEKQFYKTLACLKKKDPLIYDASTRFFKSKEESESGPSKKPVKEKKAKPMFLRDYERKVLLEKGGQLSSDEDEDRERPISPTFVEEQFTIKESFKNVLGEDSSEEQEEADGLGGLFKQKKKSKEEKVKEEDDFRQWLKGQKEELGDKEEESQLGALKSYWGNPNLETGEAFLRDYILNKRYLESDDRGKMKVNNGLAHDSDEGGNTGDEEMEERMEQFEHKYNFRFEEPDQDFLKRYPRTMSGSMRQKDDRRKVHRDDVKQRKEREKEQKRQELKQLKAIKRKEIEERLQKLKEVTGNEDIQFEGVDFDEDFDPDKHDQKMQSMFNEDFYGGGGDEEEKPEFPDLDKELELENWDQYGEDGGEGSSNHQPHCDDPDFNMDCDYDPNSKAFVREMLENQTGRKKKKKRSKLSELLSKKKPKFDRDSQDIEKYMDEYYGLDYEDIVGDQPCRFKYRNVVPNTYGLTIEEILIADDKELNRWCSLKKTSQYRNDQQEWFDVQAYEKKGNMEALKRKILPSLFTEEGAEDEPTDDTSKGKKKRKKNKKKKLATPATTNTQEITPTAEETNDDEQLPSTAIASTEPSLNNKKLKVAREVVVKPKEAPKKLLKRKHENKSSERPSKRKFEKKSKASNKNNQDVAQTELSDARLKAYGINPKKFKNKIKYGNKE